MSEEQLTQESGETPEAAVDTTSTVEVIADWKDQLSEEYRTDPTISTIPSIDIAMKMLKDTKSLVGSSVRPPSTEAGQEDVSKFVNNLIEKNPHLGLMVKPDTTNPESLTEVYRSLGAPEDASGYTAPEGADAEAFGALSNTAAELGLTTKQFETLAERQIAMQAEVSNAAIAQRDEGITQLKGQWGAAFDEKVGRAVHMLDQTKAPDSLKQAVAEGNVGADVLAWVDSMATQLGSEGAPMANQLNNINVDTTAELNQKIEDIGNRLINDDLGATQRTELIQRRLKLIEQKQKFS